MKNEVPSFNQFFESRQADEAADRELLIDQFKKGLEAGYHWMVECFDIAPSHEYETSVSYIFCHTRIEAEKIWKEEHKKSFYDNAIRAYDLNQVIDDGAELVTDFWFDDEDEDDLSDEPVYRLTEISFSAEAGGAYAWDQNGSAITVHYYFEDHPRINTIKQVDREFKAWSDWYVDYCEDNDFPWWEFKDKENELVGKLAELLADTDVKIIY